MALRCARIIAVVVILALILLAKTDSSRTAVIRWNETHQVIDGFGASCADFFKPLPDQMADFFFTTSGIGLSLLRTQVVPSIADCKSFFGRQGGECVDTESGATILKGELAIAQQAVTRGVTVWSTPWSPPASMKSNGSYINGGRLLRKDYAAWAESLADYVNMLKLNDVPLYAVSVQNEPDITMNYGSATFSAQEVHDFVPYLASAFKLKMVGSTKIMIAEASQWDFSLASATMADSDVASAVDILAAHGYGPMRITAPVNYGRHVWQTEDSSPSPTYDGSMADALLWASKIHTYLTIAQVNAWHWWFLSNGPKYGEGTDNSALTDLYLDYPKRAYVTGQWSKFVRPGWHRIGVSYSGPLQLSAFKDPGTGSFAIVAVNGGKSPIRQLFVLDGCSATQSVTPWVTSEMLGLAAQAAIPVADNKFYYSIPAFSVTTFTVSNSSH